MPALVRDLREGTWGLARARLVAREVQMSRSVVRAVVGAMFGEDVEVRTRGADVARRMMERSAEPLWPHAEELAGLLALLPVAEARTRWHLGLVVARVAHTREQRLRAARLMELLAEDEGEVRCSGIEGIGVLALGEASLRESAERIAEKGLREGTKAQRCRARKVKAMLASGT